MKPRSHAKLGTMTIVLSAQLVLSGQSHTAAHRFPASADLDGTLIQEAIAWGENAKPEPYLLYPEHRQHAWIAVYTPFVRVALAAHTAKQRGSRISPSELPNWIVERVVHVVVRPAEAQVMSARRLYPEDPPLWETPITEIGLEQRGRAPFLAFIAPKWITRDLLYLNDLGGPPFTNAVAAAGFAPESLTSEVDVWGWWRKDNHFFPSLGRLEADEIKNWR